MIHVTGIARAGLYSPGRHTTNDRLILEHTAAVLERHGCLVHLVSEDDVGRFPIETDAVFSMVQGPAATERLCAVEDDGVLVINSPRAVQRCYRANLTRALARTHLMPYTIVARTDRPEIPADMHGPLWIKRGDVHATVPEDVVRVESRAEALEKLAGFRARGIPTAAVQEHLEGDVVKFYGVVDTRFFRFYLERDANVMPVALEKVRPGIEQLMRRLGLEVYGGDAVITPSGDIKVIDVNDWPSFARFRADAAQAIGEHIYGRMVRHVEERAPARMA